MSPHFLPIAIGIACALLAYGSERLHAQRCQAVGRLAFGPTAAPRTWTGIVPWLTVLACGCLGWGLTFLVLAEPTLVEENETADADTKQTENIQRVIILLDVSPSMNIVDAGEKKDKRRRDRILEVTEGICSRIALARTRFSVIAFFTSARPVVVDTSDVNVIRNVLDNLPLVWSFEPGDTQLLKGVEAAAEMARDWPAKSTTLMICTDGDTPDFSKIPQLPRSIHKVDILAVGDTSVGTMVGTHDSRQQSGILRRLAAEMRGSYYDVNTRHVPTSALTELSYLPPKGNQLKLGLKDFALIAVAVGALLLTIIPLALEYAGSGFSAAREFSASRPAKRQSPSTAKQEVGA